MTITREIIDYVANHPGSTSRNIADGLSHLDRRTVMGTVLRLYERNVLERSMTARKLNIYYAAANAVDSVKGLSLAEQSKLEAAVMQAENLERRRMFNRAAGMWLQAFSLAKGAQERDRYIQRRAACLSRAFSPIRGPEQCYLAGNFVGEP
ncbi:PerC family transcriptional regulator [Siccibacter turicensis]|uniref:PerC family transcriptional regulator n=1 Tax=Siccibacter turicensis TaxID=357233 RepID=UPI002A6B8D49|nr:PerC family transcriptional regulator [Siccibacter turicensis]MDY0970149.1 PerC family transcriptional regulator [Siccibacter turicensis]